MAMQVLALVAGIRDDVKRGRARWLRRPTLALALAALALAATGDKSRAAGVPATVHGQDPLEVLELKVKPNVILVLDSSSSMLETQDQSPQTSLASSDHPRSKLYQGKKVIRDIVAANQHKVSFQLGTYSAYKPEFSYATAGYNRFQYVASGADFPFMMVPASELTVQGAVGDALGRGLQSWQIIYPEWNRLYFGEAGGAVCYASVPSTPRFYASGTALAADLQTALGTPTCTSGGKQNTYSVSYSTASGTFTFKRDTGLVAFEIRWADPTNNIAGALGKRGASNTGLSSSDVASGVPYTLLYRTTGTGTGPAPFAGGLATTWSFWENEPPTSTNVSWFYQIGSGRFWNGETIRVTATGEVCGMDFAAPLGTGTKTNPPSILIQAAGAGCAASGNSARFTWAGGRISGNGDIGCNGFRSRSDLVPCDLRSPAPLQLEQIGPLVDTEIPFDPTTGDPKDLDGDAVPDYVEELNGSWQTAAGFPTSKLLLTSIKYESGTPIANSLIDIKGTANPADLKCVVSVDPLTDAPTLGPCPERGFTKLWNQGQAGTTNMGGPPPWQLDPIKEHGTCPDGTSGPTATCPTSERKPKEKTIVLFVTDGQDSCGDSDELRMAPPGLTDNFGSNARRAAYYAEDLYKRLDPNDPASSVTTYLLGYGFSSTTSLDYIAWGGSGLGQGLPGQPDVNWANDSDSTLKIKRAQCTTCVDAFAAPDAATLASQLQSLIDQGAEEGDFNAQQSITENLYEYVHRASTATVAYDAAKPSLRYKAIVPTRFVSNFSLPGFKGQLKAIQNDGSGGSIVAWSAGDVLRSRISAGMGLCDSSTRGGGIGECTFRELHGGATDATIGSSGARIKRRIYTASRNGVYPYTVDTLIDGTNTGDASKTGRVALWPPTATGLLHSGVTDDAAKTYDAALGLPPDAPTSFPPNPIDGYCDPNDTFKTPKKSFSQCWFDWLQRKFQACAGNDLSSKCSGSTTDKMMAARREAREIAIAFMAGAATVPAPAGGIKRATSGSERGSLLYRARPWILADSELATAAVVTPPLPAEPEATPYRPEYQIFRDGPRAGGKNPERSVASPRQVNMGFGLRNPDNDGTATAGAVDTNVGLKPVMTVVYAPANDMLHAFRAGPCGTPGLAVATCSDVGGEELWGFIPYDQLHAVMLRAAFEPQGKDNHVYMLARGVRYSDVFVPGAFSRSMGSATVSSTQGVWRRILYFGRGIGGKYMTALDVTGPGPYTASALATRPPEPLWSRGNPDTRDGLVGGSKNNNQGDFDRYATMGETWSIPVVAYVNKFASPYNGKDYVLFVGSGYSSQPTEGSTFYTLDALTGNVIETATVDPRPGMPYPNALVANPVGFNPKAFSPLTTVHPAAAQVTRVYIGDVHGRLWKFLTAAPNTALMVADLGADQPVGAAASLLGMPPYPGRPVPFIYVTSGADRRAAGPFQMYAFRDDGTDTDVAIGASSSSCEKETGATCTGTVATNMPAVRLFTRVFDQGEPFGDCGYTTEAVFRGTVQPATAFECGSISVGSCSSPVGRTFYAGTRLSVPNTKFAPLTPLACGAGAYPCRSQFDSTVYVLGATTGQAAYELNSSGDNAYRIFRDSRIAAITVQGDPDPGRGGSSVALDEGLMKGVPKPPPPPGVPPTSTTATANVVMVREPGQPAPAIRYGSTVCQ